MRFVTPYVDPIRGFTLMRTNDQAIAARLLTVETKVVNRLNASLILGKITPQEYQQAIAGYNRFVLYVTVYRQTGNPLAKSRALEGYRVFLSIYQR